jgi:hypothetical protein
MKTFTLTGYFDGAQFAAQYGLDPMARPPQFWIVAGKDGQTLYAPDSVPDNAVVVHTPLKTDQQKLAEIVQATPVLDGTKDTWDGMSLEDKVETLYDLLSAKLKVEQGVTIPDAQVTDAVATAQRAMLGKVG